MGNTQSDSLHGVESRSHTVLRYYPAGTYTMKVLWREDMLHQVSNEISIQDRIFLLCTHSSGVSSTLQQLHTLARRATLRVF